MTEKQLIEKLNEFKTYYENNILYWYKQNKINQAYEDMKILLNILIVPNYEQIFKYQFGIEFFGASNLLQNALQKEKEAKDIPIDLFENNLNNLINSIKQNRLAQNHIYYYDNNE